MSSAASESETDADEPSEVPEPPEEHEVKPKRTKERLSGGSSTDLGNVDRHLDDVLNFNVDDLRDRDLANLLDGLDLDLGHVHVAGEGNVLDLDDRNVADDLSH